MCLCLGCGVGVMSGWSLNGPGSGRVDLGGMYVCVCVVSRWQVQIQNPFLTAHSTQN